MFLSQNVYDSIDFRNIHYTMSFVNKNIIRHPFIQKYIFLKPALHLIIIVIIY